MEGQKGENWDNCNRTSKNKTKIIKRKRKGRKREKERTIAFKDCGFISKSIY